MKRFARFLGTGAVALTCLVVTATSAHAGTTYHGQGVKYKRTSKSIGCQNHVYMWTEGGNKVRAYATQHCDRAVPISRPTIALSGNNGKTFVTGGKACKAATYCQTEYVTLKMTKGWTYRASNAGTASTGAPGEGDAVWPDNTVARVTKKAPF
ncbi:hypothetical protein ACGF8B_39145 [Streptomyces sp. NPDC047917]|uniref:hypothetical protein n=1 Tax=Streptomyces sp. NPDC047917 TaxID=3365491 RepID=UPI003713BA83